MAKSTRIGRLFEELSLMLGNVGDVIASIPTYCDPFPYRFKPEKLPEATPSQSPAKKSRGIIAEKRRAEKRRNKKKAKYSKKRRK